MNNFRKSILIIAALLIAIPSFSQGLKAFKLKNGLTVYIWEDSTKTTVTGYITVRAGSINEPKEYTGLAHYLEHVLFKGTDKISTLDWETEEPIYKQIIQKYDDMANEQDPVKKAAINKEINDLTLKEAKVSESSEFTNIMQNMGIGDLNAMTSWDYTTFVSSFPAYQINKWLEISSQRFINPVFRTFQAELETVYEEYNRAQDNPSEAEQNFFFEKAFQGHPYSRPVIGSPEHLKNPRLSKLIDFYNNWYVPENMALVLVGNVKAQDVSRTIAATFGRWKAKQAPQRETYTDLNIQGRTQYLAKVGSYPSVNLVFKGVKAGDKDEHILDVALSLLSNESKTGILDKMVMEGDMTEAQASSLFLREQGRCVITAIPLYDDSQMRFQSNKSTEKLINNALDELRKLDITDASINMIKANMCRDFDLQMESNDSKTNVLTEAFVNNVDLSHIINYKDEIMAITPADVKRVINQYLNDNYLAIYIEKGKENKKDKIKKPEYKPVDSPEGQQSEYAQQFKTMPIGEVKEKILNFNDVQNKQMNDHTQLHYTNNTENNVFSMILRYGAGKRVFPKLGVAAQLMNNAGVMGAYSPQEFKNELGKINVSYSVQATDDYLYIVMKGYEQNLTAACQLLAKQVLMPKLDLKQLDNIKGNTLSERQIQQETVNSLSAALNEYQKYGDKSDYIDRLTDKEVINLGISELTGDINRASGYGADIFYTGTLPFNNVYDILSHNLPLVANEKASDSPQDKPYAQVKENTVYFLPNQDAEQTKIYFFIPSANFDKEDLVKIGAFNYGFYTLAFNELREKRSMVYTTDGRIKTPKLKGDQMAFEGFLGTQNDKAMDALKLFNGLIQNMSIKSDRIDDIKSFLKEASMSQYPDFRDKAQTIEYYKQQGFTQDPVVEALPRIEALTYNDLVDFYNKNIKGRPYSIAIIGNPKTIDLDQLKQYGKVVKLSNDKLFNSKDKLAY